MRIIAAILAVALAPITVQATDGYLDPGFGVGGIVEISWPAGSAQANAVGVDGTGRILVGGSAAGVYGNADFALFRLLPDGRLDMSYAADAGGFRLIDFNLDGIGGHSNDAVNDLAVLDDGSVVGVGEAHFGFAGVNSQFALARLDADGDPDPGFGRNGGVHFGLGEFANIDHGLRLALDTQGRIAVAGRIARQNNDSPALDWLLGVARVTADGEFDRSFFGNGSYAAVFWADPTLPPPRSSHFNVPLALALDASERILVAGVVAQPIAQDAAIYRAPADGGYDPGFGQFARVQIGLDGGEASALLPLPGGGVLVAGGYATGAGTYSLFLAQRLDDGSPDIGFGTNGLSAIPLKQGYPEPSLIARTREGGWLVAGRLTDPTSGGGLGFVLARFDAQGQPRAEVGEGGALAIDSSDGRHFNAGRAVLQPGGTLVVAGSLPNTAADITPHFALMRIVVDESVFADGFDGP